jgi:hypothetical protein
MEIRQVAIPQAGRKYQAEHTFKGGAAVVLKINKDSDPYQLS